MIALLAATIALNATPAIATTDDQKLVALTVTALRGCRKLEIQGFTIYQGYALGGWGCVHSGGMIAAVKWDGRWIRLTSGGGAINAEELHSNYEVPPDVARVLVAPCPSGRSHALAGSHVAAGATICTP